MPDFGNLLFSMSPQSLLGGFLNAIGVFLEYTWWLILFGIIFTQARNAFLVWRQETWQAKMKWVVLEMKIPRLIETSPRRMDQFFQHLHTLRNEADHLDEKYPDGEIPQRYMFEMASFEGQTHFYMRVPVKQRNMIEAAFLGYYPDVELIEIEDYMDKLPQNITDLERRGLDIWCTEFYLNKHPALPIKTYKVFESPDEQHQFDPMSSFLEVMGKIKQGEYLGMQILVEPLHRNYAQRFDPVIEELREPKYGKEKMGAGEFTFQPMMMKSPGETETLKQIEENLAKPLFVLVVRVAYMAPKPTFYDGLARRGLRGAFNQYSSADLNYFKDNVKNGTKPGFWDFPYVYPEQRRRIRKQRNLKLYLGRGFGTHDNLPEIILYSHWLAFNLNLEKSIISSEGLASLFHPPTQMVLTAPHTERSESRKVGPSSGLPIYGDESALEKFLPKES